MALRRAIIWGLGAAVMLIAGSAFLNKMVEFGITIRGHEVDGFGLIALTTYLVGMVPIVCIMLWAVFTGRFADIEGPKYRMLELDLELDREAALASRGGRRG